jgi:hypothetical protein
LSETGRDVCAGGHVGEPGPHCLQIVIGDANPVDVAEHP